MSKYINIFLFSFFGVLSIKYNMALTFYIPLVCYYVYKNIKIMETKKSKVESYE